VTDLIKGEIISEKEAPDLNSLKIIDADPDQDSRANGSAYRFEYENALSLDRDDSPIYDYLKGLAKGSQRTQVSALKSVLAALDLEKMLRHTTPQDSQKLFDYLWAYPWHKVTRRRFKGMIVAQRDLGYAGATISRNMSAVRRVMEICTESDYRQTVFAMDPGDYAEATKPRGLPKIKKNPGGVTGRAFTEEEIRLLFEACEIREDGEPEHPATVARDKAVLAMLFLRAMRVGEAMNLMLENYNPRTGNIKVTDSKTESGIRKVPADAAKIYLDAWLELRKDSGDRPEHKTSGPIFFEVNRIGGIVVYKRIFVANCLYCGYDYKAGGPKKQYKNKAKANHSCPECGRDRDYSQIQRPLSNNAVRSLLRKRCAIAEVAMATTHDGRRTAVTWAYENGGLAAAQALAGHKSPEQTLKYLRYSQTHHAAARQNLHARQARVLELESPEDPNDEDSEAAELYELAMLAKAM